LPLSLLLSKLSLFLQLKLMLSSTHDERFGLVPRDISTVFRIDFMPNIFKAFFTDLAYMLEIISNCLVELTEVFQ